MLKLIFKRLRDILIDSKVIDAIDDLEQRLLAVELKLGLQEKPPEAVKVIFYTTIRGKTSKLGGNMFLKITDKLPVSVKFQDALGNDAKVDGLPVWSSSDESLGKLNVAADGLSADYVPNAVGKLKIQVSADADLGQGVKNILGELEIDIISGEAVAVSISAGEAVTQDAAPVQDAPVVEEPVVEPAPENPLDLNTGN